jgi:CRISPR-associated protein Cas5d
MKVERMSYEVMTPSAARGILEAVLWKPAITWRIASISVGAPVRWIAVRRNEVNGTASDRVYCADEDRAQRNTVALRDVDYLVSGWMELTPKAGPEDTLEKFEAMFERRVERGQRFHQPYLGCREFAAEVSFDLEGFKPAEDGGRSLGLMLYDIAYGEERRALYFDAKLEGGKLLVPGWDEVLKENGVRS